MDRAERIAGIVEDCQERLARGESVDTDDVLAQNPDIAEELAFHFEITDLFAKSTSGRLRELESWVPRQIGEYRIVRELARGGMGVVYEAEQASLKRRVALKVLSPSFTQVSRAVGRFRREGRAAAALHHTNIVPVHAMGQHGSLWYYAMDLVDGQPLHRVLAELRAARDKRGSSCSGITSEHLGTNTGRPAYFRRVAAMFAGVADGLDAAHRASVIHRDIKPSNLLLDADGRLMIVDFGLARYGDGEPDMTVTGDLLGTPTYMSPEQALARRGGIDHRTDIYSLGATLYEALTLRPPFEGSNFQVLCQDIVAKEPTSPRRLNATCPRDLETILLKAMEKEPRLRYQTAAEFGRDLRAFAEGESIRARRIGPLDRAWRQVRRHKVRSTLAAAALICAVAWAVVSQRAQRESDRAARETNRARQAEYELLLVRSQGAMVAAGNPVPATTQESRRETLQRMNRMTAPNVDAMEILARAVELVPDRPEGYWLRVFVGGRTPAQRLADLEEARARGLAPRAYQLARASLLEHEARWEEADAARRRAERHPRTPESDFFEALIYIDTGRFDDALDRLGRLLESAAHKDHVLRYLALRNRAQLHIRRGMLPAALNDLVGLQHMGDASIGVRVHIASVWKRMQKEEVARETFEGVLRDVEELGTPSAWHQLCAACRFTAEVAWHDRASEEGLRVHPKAVALVRERIEALRSKKTEVALEEAEALCRSALAWAANHHVLHGELATVLRLQGRLEDARAAYERALEHGDKCVRCIWGLGVTLSLMQRDDLAAERFEAVIRLDPRAVEGYHSLGISLAALGRHDEAEQAHRRALRIASVASVHTQLGILLYDRKRYDEALAQFDKAIELAPESAWNHANRGHALLAMEQPDAAFEAFGEALALDPKMIGLHNNRAVIHIRRGESADALREADAELKLRPDSAKGHTMRGHILSSLKQYDKAMKAFREAIRCDEGYSVAYDALAELLVYHKKDPRAAVEVLTRGLEAGGESVILYVRRGSICADDFGEDERALADFQAAIETHAKGDRSAGSRILKEEAFFRAHRNSGIVLRKMHRLGPAIEAYRKTLELKPGDGHVVFNLVGMLRQVGKADEAIAVLAKLPTNAQAHHTRGEIRLAQGRYEDALAGYEKAIELSHGARTPYGGALHTLFESGAFDETLEMSKRALRRFGDDVYFRSMHVRALRALGREDDARECARRWVAGDVPPGHVMQFAYMVAAAGQDKRANAILERDETAHAEPAWTRASVHATLGDKKAALHWLRRAFDQGHRRPAAASPDPELHALLAGDAQYAALMRRIHAHR